jgi:uncharacterized protein (DUF2225 family)
LLIKTNTVMKKYLVILFLILSFTFNAQVEWKREKIKCPVCGIEQNMLIPAQNLFGIDNESQFQLIFFPFNEHQSIYTCTKCKYSALMDDFFKVDTTFISNIENIDISGLALGKIRTYTNIDVTDRLLLAEKFYEAKNLDIEFWCRFYRICAYHFERQDYIQEAREYREKALKLSQKMLHDRNFAEGREKEFLLISGSMFYYLNETDSAYLYVRNASMRTYTGNARKIENIRSKESLLTRISQQFSVKLRKERLEMLSK